MKTYGQFCPIAQALEILAERWTLLVVRELLLGSTRFSELQRGVPLMSRTLLAQRLRTLQDCGVVLRLEGAAGPEYRLTDAGEALFPVVESIGAWGKAYAHREITDEQLDPSLLMWDMQRRLNWSAIPKQRTVVLFRFADAKRGQKRFWLHLERQIADVCLTNPGFAIDLELETDVRTLTEIWRGKRSLEAALRAGDVALMGPPALKRAFPSWLLLSPFAKVG